MPQVLLIDETYINTYRTIASTVNEAKRVTPFVYEAQVFDLKPLLGATLYDDLIDNTTDAKYLTLLNGEQYVDPNGYTVNFEGLGACLVYFAYARFLENQQITVTSHGVVTKDSPYSTPVDSKTLTQRINQVRSGAFVYFEQVAKYLTDKNTSTPNTYDLWLNDLPDTRKTSAPRLSAVDGFNRRFSKGGSLRPCGCVRPCTSYIRYGYC
jgi:hypothetical protein